MLNPRLGDPGINEGHLIFRTIFCINIVSEAGTKLIQKCDNQIPNITFRNKPSTVRYQYLI